MEPAARHVIVVGGGIAGLSTAWFLARDGRPGTSVTVLESSNAVGGKLRAAEVAGATVDIGAESLLLRRTEGSALISDVGLTADLVLAATTTADIWSRGQLRAVPPET